LRSVVPLEAQHRTPDGEPVVDDVPEAVAPDLGVQSDIRGAHRVPDGGAGGQVAGGELVLGDRAIGAVDTPVDLRQQRGRTAELRVAGEVLGEAVDE